MAAELAEPWRVELNEREWLLLDHVGKGYRVAHYHKPTAKAPEDAAVRTAAVHVELLEALRIVLAEGGSRCDERTVEWYVRSTDWGAGLP